LEPKVDESSNPYDLKLAMVVVYNSNDDIPSNTNWEFGLRNVGLNYLKSTYIDQM
jgi:hypothetical protein